MDTFATPLMAIRNALRFAIALGVKGERGPHLALKRCSYRKTLELQRSGCEHIGTFRMDQGVG